MDNEQSRIDNNRFSLNLCLNAAEEEYNSLWNANGTRNANGSYTVNSSIRDWLEKKLATAKDDCYQQYPVR